VQTLRRYRPQPYHGRISIIVNEQEAQHDPTLGWADLVSGGVDVYRAVGDHETYIRTHVDVVAQQLTEALAKADADGDGRAKIGSDGSTGGVLPREPRAGAPAHNPTWSEVPDYMVSRESGYRPPGGSEELER
jgi:hypothetical protein